ncbi:MAG: DUF3347 domain-containing protein [Myxococcales bacterium]|nr:DUF3347 domain-containing protein [Myxococcales bacterium]
MTKFTGSVFMGVVLVGATLAGCKEKTEVSTQGASPAVASDAAASTQAASTQAASTQAAEASQRVPVAAPTPAPGVAGMLDTYERLRAALAQDELAELGAIVSTLQQTASSAAETGSAAAVEHLRAAASAAEAMASSVDDPSAARKAFGEVSRAVVALLTADPELARGKYLFECPMATGYKKWVQTSEEISNPYMGKAMPACGAAAEW